MARTLIMSNYSRRDFIKTSAGILGAAVLLDTGCSTRDPTLRESRIEYRESSIETVGRFQICYVQ